MLRTKSGPAIPSSMIRYPWTRFLTGCAAAGSGASIPGRFPVPFFLPDDNFLNRNPSIIDRPMTGLYSGCRTLCYNERSQQQRQRNPGGRCVKRIIALFFIVVCTVLLLLLFTSILAGKNAPLIPKDIFHEKVIANAGCTTCHTPGKQVPLTEKHPPGV